MKRRDITLGEMQDECKKRDGMCCGVESWDACAFYKVCPFQMQSRKALGWDLSDPPRFTEAQMAFWRGWHAMGATFVRRLKDGNIWLVNERGDDVGTIKSSFDLADILEIGETLDLAELLGKDSQ